jgi:FMN-dependent oxidoreductase (nitrilotriacetate monooxygenase family)
MRFRLPSRARSIADILKGPAMPTRKLHINVNLQGAGGHVAAWRAPSGNPRGPIDLKHFQQVARIAERGLCDGVFLAELLAAAPDLNAAPMWALEPLMIATSMAAVTKKIGFIVSNSTTFNQPYSLARSILSLDHLSGGRVGWNVVTAYDPRAAHNFGLGNLPSHDDRYAKAAEFIDVVLGLWDSWETAGLALNTATDQWGDPRYIHRLDHVGQHFSVAGPLQVPRSPQGRPVVVQAGGSPQGRDLAARYAELVFAAQHDIGDARAFYTDVKDRAKAYGRKPEEIAILPGLTMILGGTEAEAKKRKADLDDIAGGDAAALQRFAARVGLDAKELDLDRPVPEHLAARWQDAGASKGFADATYALVRTPGLTVRQIIAAGGGHHRTLVGTPEQITADIFEWFTTGAADGFNIMADIYPSGLESFVDHVVPLLQRRGIYRQQYEGETLRSHYGLPEPANRYSAAAADRSQNAG